MIDRYGGYKQREYLTVLRIIGEIFIAILNVYIHSFYNIRFQTR